MDKTFDAAARRARDLRRVGGGRRLPRRRRRPGPGAAALLHHDPAAERDRRAAHGPRLQQHAPGHPHPLAPDARATTPSGSPAPTTPASPPRWSSSASSRRTATTAAARWAASEFVERVWQQKQRSRGNIRAQLERLGASCDWSREAFTMTGAPGDPDRTGPNFHDAVLKVFVDFYDKGLIYRGKRLVNWDPHFETAISDLEVEHRRDRRPHVALQVPARPTGPAPRHLRVRREGRGRHRHPARDPRLHLHRHHPPRDDARRRRRRGPPLRRPLRPHRRPALRDPGRPQGAPPPDPDHHRPLPRPRPSARARSRSPARTTSTTTPSPSATASRSTA